MSFDIITGLPSISHALKNSKRDSAQLFTTKETIKELKKRKLYHSGFDNIEITYMKPHDVQEKAKKLYAERDFKFSRVPSNAILITNQLDYLGPAWLYSEIENKESIKIFCLDQVTDAHNGAAILRTAAFYGVDALIVPSKGNFGKSPSFYRIASGAVEHVPIVEVGNLTKTITKLKDLGVFTLGFSEHESENFKHEHVKGKAKVCFVMGAEDRGISHAVLRMLDQKVALSANGEVKSLNVSVATAIAMDRLFS